MAPDKLWSGLYPAEPSPLRWLRLTLLSATGISLLCCARLWLSDRPYPLLPIAPWFPVLPPKWDLAFFVLMMASLVAALRYYRPAVLGFLLGTLYLALSDQSRWQPWFYMYWVMLLLTLAPGATGAALGRVALSAVYFWAGAQKLNPHFFKEVAPWFVEPAGTWIAPGIVAPLRYVVSAAPVLEIFIAFALWPRRTRPIALLTCGLVHGASLLFLGPAGHHLNWVIWPWNLATPALALILFPPRRPMVEAPPVRPPVWAWAAVLLFSLLPALSFVGWWDSYLSFSLYSGNLTTADLFLSRGVWARLPPEVQKYVPTTPTPYNQELQGPYVVRVDLWALHTLNVPPLPEARNYLHLARYFATFAANPNDVRLVLLPRTGGTFFYRGGDLRPAAGIPLNF